MVSLAIKQIILRAALFGQCIDLGSVIGVLVVATTPTSGDNGCYDSSRYCRVEFLFHCYVSFNYNKRHRFNCNSSKFALQ